MTLERALECIDLYPARSVPEEIRVNFRTCLRVYRKWWQYTQAQMAERIGVPRTVYLIWENGPSLPLPRRRERLRALPGVSMELVTGTARAEELGRDFISYADELLSYGRWERAPRSLRLQLPEQLTTLLAQGVIRPEQLGAPVSVVVGWMRGKGVPSVTRIRYIRELCIESAGGSER